MSDLSSAEITETAQAFPKAGRKEWIGLAVIALPCLLYSMDLTVLNLALPSISAELKPSSAQLLWIVDIYGFLVAGSLITMGTIGDRIGRRRLLLIGAACFGCASVIAAFSPNANMLIATRALLGIAGATIAPSTLSLIRNMFHDPNQRTFAIGIWATSYSVGGAIGPLLGGIMLEYFWWGSVFLLGVPVMVLLLIVGPILLPEFKDPRPGKLDVTSAAMSLISILSIIYCLKLFAEGQRNWTPLLIASMGIVIGILFIRRQKKLKDPLVDLKLFQSKGFSVALVINTLAIMMTFGSFFYTAQYLQMVLGLTPFIAGLWTIPSSVAFVVGSMFTSTIVKRSTPAVVMSCGLVLAAIGFVCLTQVSDAGLVLLVTASILMSFGICPSIILSTDLVMGSAPPERSGSAASLSETSSEMGGALGIAILGSIGTFIYRLNMTDVENRLQNQVTDNDVETLGGALATAANLSGDTRTWLIDSAKNAFITAFESISLISAIGCLGIAVAAIVLLRKK
jgi:MFS transporter, DHA2 family, multidrug resistance protein